MPSLCFNQFSADKFGDFRCLKNIPPEYIAQHVIEAVEAKPLTGDA